MGLLCGLGNPEAFRRSVEEAGYAVPWAAAYPDHHPYRAREVEAVLERAASEGLDGVVTTQKDAIRIASTDTALGAVLSVALLEIRWIEEEAEQVLRAKLRTCSLS